MDSKSDISEEACGQWIVYCKRNPGQVPDGDPDEMRFIADSIEELGKRSAVLWIDGKRLELHFDEVELEKSKCR